MLAELDDLAREVEAIRAGAADTSARLARLPAERASAEDAVRDAEAEANARHGGHEAAARDVDAAERARDDARVRAARRAEVRARDAVRMAERRLDAARAAMATLAGEERRLNAQAQALAERARAAAGMLVERPGLAEQAGRPPVGDLKSIAAWATDARAALFVARGNLARQRDGLIRQANELGAAVLGEPLSASSAAVVARRVESET
jgi:chromosome segregation protein